MSSDLWAEKPEPLPVGWAEILYYSKPDMDAFHEKLKEKITQLHECLGEYESKEWCGHCIVDSKCAQITMHIIELKKKGDVLDFLFGEKSVRTENLMKLQIWREKAEKWDKYSEAFMDSDFTVIPFETIEALVNNLKAVKDILKLPKCENADETPDIILGFEEQYYLKKILEARVNDDS